MSESPQLGLNFAGEQEAVGRVEALLIFLEPLDDSRTIGFEGTGEGLCLGLPKVEVDDPAGRADVVMQKLPTLARAEGDPEVEINGSDWAVAHSEAPGSVGVFLQGTPRCPGRASANLPTDPAVAYTGDDRRPTP